MWRVQGQGRQLWICQSLFVSFLSLNRPPLALGRLRRIYIYSAGNLNEPKKGQFHGNWVWNRQRIKKKKQGRLFQCSRAAGGLFNGCLTVARTHLLTMPCTTHTHINTNTAMHWCIDSNMHKLWTLDSPRHASSHICTHIHTHAVVFDFGSVAWGFKILDYGTVPELCNLLSSHS